MTKVIVQAPTPDDTTFEAPRRDDGLWFAHMIQNGDDMIFADTFTELVGALIDGYDDIPRTPEGDEEAWIQRYLHGANIAAAFQGDINAQAAANGALAACTPAEVDVLFRDKQHAFDGIDGSLEWTCQVPLLLIDAHYQPVNPERPMPTGRVAWVEIDTENSFITSLDRLGLITYGFREGDDVGEAYPSEPMDDDDAFTGDTDDDTEGGGDPLTSDSNLLDI